MGFLVNHRGIKPNSGKKIQVLLGMNPLKIVREVQHLIGRLEALSRFITRPGEQSLLFFKALRNTLNF